MPKLYVGEAIALVFRTMPILLVRLGSYLVLGLGLGLYFALVGGLAWLLGMLWAPLGFIVFAIAIGGSFWLVNLATRYWFHLLRAAHTAVLTEFITTGSGPAGNQLQFGREQVMRRFRDTSILFGVDMLVGGVVRFIVRTFTRITSLLRLPGIATLGSLLQRVAVMSTTYVDEAILSRAYSEDEDNVWKVAADGTVLYAQAWKPILTNAVVLALLSYVEFFLFLLVLAVPAVALGAAFPGARLALGIGVFIMAWMLKLAVSDAFSLAATLLAFHRSTEGMTPDPEWVARLENASEQFRELAGRAARHVGGRAAAPAGAPDMGPEASAGLPGDAADEPAGT